MYVCMYVCMYAEPLRSRRQSSSLPAPEWSTSDPKIFPTWDHTYCQARMEHEAHEPKYGNTIKHTHTHVCVYIYTYIYIYIYIHTHIVSHIAYIRTHPLSLILFTFIVFHTSRLAPVASAPSATGPPSWWPANAKVADQRCSFEVSKIYMPFFVWVHTSFSKQHLSVISIYLTL